jgi:hypothetical protein
MKVEGSYRIGGHWKKAWGQEGERGVNVIKVHSTQLWKFHNETHYFIYLIQKRKTSVIWKTTNNLKGMRLQSYRSVIICHKAVNALKLKICPPFKGLLHLIGAKPQQVPVWHSYDSLSSADHTEQ